MMICRNTLKQRGLMEVRPQSMQQILIKLKMVYLLQLHKMAVHRCRDNLSRFQGVQQHQVLHQQAIVIQAYFSAARMSLIYQVAEQE